MLETWRAKQLKKSLSLLSIPGDGKLEIESGEVWLCDDVVRVLDVIDGADLLLSSSCSCGSESNHSCLRSQFLFDHFVQHQVCRSEVMTPFT